MKKYELNKVKIGNKIFNIRTSLGMSMEEFSKKIKVSAGAVNNYEKGRILPRTRVLSKIIRLSEEPNQTVNNFLYGTAREYLFDIFDGVDVLSNPFIKGGLSYPIGTGLRDYPEVIYQLSEMLDNGELKYGDEAAIVLEASKIEEELKDDTRFIELWDLYDLPELTYKIEHNDFYRKTLLPYLNKNLGKIKNEKDLDEYSATIVFLSKLFYQDILIKNSTYPILKNRILGNVMNLENYFSKDELNAKSDSEKELLKNYLDDFGQKFFYFASAFDNKFSLSIEDLVRYYSIEKDNIKNEYKKNLKEFLDTEEE